MGTVAAMVGVIFFFIMGAINRKIGARLTSFLCLILAGIGYFGMGHANSLLQYGVSLCICTIGAMSAGYIAGGALVAQWFPKKKGIVMGYTTMGHNMATGFFVPMITVLVAIASGGYQFVSTVIITQLVVRNQEVGFTQTQAVAIMTILAFAGILGSWIIGAMDQKIGTKKTMIFFGIWYAAALLLEVTEIRALVIVFLVMFALALGGSANFTTSLPAAVFGRHGFKKVNSVLFPIQALVSSFGFMVNGNVLNATGSLRMSYVIAAIASLIVVVIVVFIKEHEYNRDFMTEEQAEAFTKQLMEGK